MVLNSKKKTQDDAVVHGVVIVVNKQHAWTGTMTNLFSALNKVLTKRQLEVLPGSPSALRVVLNRVANRLRNRSVGVRFGRTTDHARTRFVKFTR